MKPAKDYIVQIKVKNGPMLRAMRRSAVTVQALSRAAGVNQSYIYAYLNLKISPQRNDGDWRPSIISIAVVLRCLPEDLFPPQHIRDPLTVNNGEIEASLEDVEAFLLPSGDVEASLEAEDRKRLLAAAIETLYPRDRRIIIERFGLDGEEPKTLAAVGAHGGWDGGAVTPTTVMIAEKRAMRNLKKALAPLREELFPRHDSTELFKLKQDRRKRAVGPAKN